MRHPDEGGLQRRAQRGAGAPPAHALAAQPSLWAACLPGPGQLLSCCASAGKATPAGSCPVRSCTVRKTTAMWEELAMWGAAWLPLSRVQPFVYSGGGALAQEAFQDEEVQQRH